MLQITYRNQSLIQAKIQESEKRF